MSDAERIRAFLALDLPGPLIEAVAAWQVRALGAGRAVRPIRPDALHVTLAFLGDLTADEVARTTEVLLAQEAVPLPLRLAPSAVGVPAGAAPGDRLRGRERGGGDPAADTWRAG